MRVLASSGLHQAPFVAPGMRCKDSLLFAMHACLTLCNANRHALQRHTHLLAPCRQTPIATTEAVGDTSQHRLLVAPLGLQCLTFWVAVPLALVPASHNHTRQQAGITQSHVLTITRLDHHTCQQSHVSTIRRVNNQTCQPNACVPTRTTGTRRASMQIPWR